MYTKTDRWAAHWFNKFDFEEESADGTLFEERETRWILEESPERTNKAIPSTLGDDGLKRRQFIDKKLKIRINYIKLDIHHNSVLFHLDRRPVRFPIHSSR
ncbi:hypothetical protein AVEN_148944-1 [Araneus ventricosus]|uniref:Uncharacterized protein n=1 Tax=Araneus ventricosus TaxID=182803 RepID=A0A4Y2FQ67_ARAVE|nr:hypothetical protein AVEN_148944-1 [Araneus ventricosus]